MERNGGWRGRGINVHNPGGEHGLQGSKGTGSKVELSTQLTPPGQQGVMLMAGGCGVLAWDGSRE